MVKPILPILLILWCPLVQAQIYKWVDEQGRIQYSELPPQNHSYEVLNRPPSPSQNTTAPQPESASRPPASEGTRQKTAASRQNQDEDANRAKDCEQARLNLDILATSQNPVLIDSEGHETLLDEEQRQAAMARNREYIQNYCTP